MRFWKFIKNKELEEQLSPNSDEIKEDQNQSQDMSGLPQEDTLEKQDDIDIKDTPSQDESSNNELSEDGETQSEDSLSKDGENTTEQDSSFDQGKSQDMSGLPQEGTLEKKDDIDPEDTPSQDESSNNELSEDGETQSEDSLSKDGEESSLPDGSTEDDELDDIESEEIIESQSKKETIEKLQKLRDVLEQYAKQKAEQMKKSLEKVHREQQDGEIIESKEDDYELSDNANQFLEQLGDLPSFKDRKRGPGYSIDTEGYTEVPDSMIRTLITKFLNQRFCKHSTDLNMRSNSLEKSRGFYKWEVKDVITHLQTHQITKVLDDKYGYEYANGKNEFVPLSFYFDMSGSMSEYTNMLAIIAIELLKKNVKVLIGFNERVNVQIDSIDKNIDIKELASILESAGYSSWGYSKNKDRLKKESRVSLKFIDRNIDNYLLSKKAEKCVVFSDFDPKDEIINLSHGAQVYWFCFEKSFEASDLGSFEGFIYKVQNAIDIANGLIKVNENRFESLCYIDESNILQRVLGGK